MTKTLKNNDFYTTSSLSLAATISLRYPIEAIDKTNPNKALFLFKREEGLDDLVESFWRREQRVEPQTYFDQLKNIKTRLYGNE